MSLATNSAVERNPKWAKATIMERYDHVAELHSIAVSDLLPPDYHAHFEKAEQFAKFLTNKESNTGLFDVSFVMANEPNQWGKLLQAQARERAEAQILGGLQGLPDELRYASESALTGSDAFDHVMATLEVDGAITTFRDVATAYNDHTELSTVGLGHYERQSQLWAEYQRAAEKALFIDLALPDIDHARAALWVDPGELSVLEYDVRRDRTGRIVESTPRFTDAEKSAHDAATEWLDMYESVTTTYDSHTRKISPERLRVDGIPGGDRAITYLVSGRIPDVQLNVARTFQELERRVAMFALAGRTAINELDN